MISKGDEGGGRREAGGAAWPAHRAAGQRRRAAREPRARAALRQGGLSGPTRGGSAPSPPAPLTAAGGAACARGKPARDRGACARAASRLGRAPPASRRGCHGPRRVVAPAVLSPAQGRALRGSCVWRRQRTVRGGDASAGGCGAPRQPLAQARGRHPGPPPGERRPPPAATAARPVPRGRSACDHRGRRRVPARAWGPGVARWTRLGSRARPGIAAQRRAPCSAARPSLAAARPASPAHSRALCGRMPIHCTGSARGRLPADTMPNSATPLRYYRGLAELSTVLAAMARA